MGNAGGRDLLHYGMCDPMMQKKIQLKIHEKVQVNFQVKVQESLPIFLGDHPRPLLKNAVEQRDVSRRLVVSLSSVTLCHMNLAPL
jgi:hypothetical protein